MTLYTKLPTFFIKCPRGSNKTLNSPNVYQEIESFFFIKVVKKYFWHRILFTFTYDCKHFGSAVRAVGGRNYVHCVYDSTFWFSGMLSLLWKLPFDGVNDICGVN